MRLWVRTFPVTEHVQLDFQGMLKTHRTAQKLRCFTALLPVTPRRGTITANKTLGRRDNSSRGFYHRLQHHLIDYSFSVNGNGSGIFTRFPFVTHSQINRPCW